MNIYRITAADGSQAGIQEDITERNEKAAKKAFQLRHIGSKIVEVELVRTNVAASKQQEFEALAAIRQMVDDLGPQSYLSAAFQGCFDLAEENIVNDFLNSFPGQLAGAEREMAEMAEKINGIQALQKRIESLEKALDRELEWTPFESKFNVKQADYAELAVCQATNCLSDGESLELIVREFGFEREKITILHSVDQEEVNRHHRVRVVGEIERLPLYCSTDWNYIRFDCSGRSYEMFNGDLRQFVC